MDPKERSDAGNLKKLAVKRVKELSGDSNWTILEQIAQEIQAHHVVLKEPLTNTKHLQFLKDEVKARYTEQSDILEVLEDGIPSLTTLGTWKKKKDWDEAVWGKVRGEGLFTNDNRAKLIGKLFDQAATDGNVAAAKIWLTLSGDYSEKDGSAKNDAMDMFRQLNEAIHSKK